MNQIVYYIDINSILYEYQPNNKTSQFSILCLQHIFLVVIF